jgi:hypothetical protein
MRQSSNARRVSFFSILILVFVCCATVQCMGQPTANVLRRVFLIQVGAPTATSFTIDVDGRQYLLTAKHVVAGLGAEGTINVRKGAQWMPLKVKVLRCDDPIDIAVLVPPEQISVTLQLEPTSQGMIWGQDLFFVGFPYDVSLGLFTDGANINGGFPIGFIKKAIISASHIDGVAVSYYLDGHNNPGFSGSPVVFRDKNQESNTFKVLGVISGYRTEYSHVLEPVRIQTSEITPEDIATSRIVYKNGQPYRLRDTGRVVSANTGIVVAWNISRAVDLIKRNPIGPKTSDAFVNWEPSAKK